MVRRQRPFPMRPYQIVVDHRSHIVKAELLDLGNLVRGAEAVEEVQEWNTRLQRRGVRNQGQIHRFLDRVRGQQRKSRWAYGHGILMVAEDRQRVSSDGARSHVYDGGRQL